MAEEITILDAECGNIIAVYHDNNTANFFMYVNGLCPYARIGHNTISAFATKPYNIDPRFDCVDIDSLIFTPGLVERG